MLSILLQNITFLEININGSIFVPNTFTPNGDGNNDKFEIKGENIKDFELWIYNRWGELLFTSTDVNKTWDGSYQDIMVMNYIVKGYCILNQ